MKRGISYLFFGLILIILSLISVSSVFAAVVINEAEINPSGSDSGNEWVEIFNNGNEVNLSGWYISTAGGLNHSLDNVSLPENSFYIKQGFNPAVADSNQNLKLFDKNNNLVSQTGIFTDNTNNADSYSRVPDVTGAFISQLSTKNSSNQPTIIQDKTDSPLCILNGDNVRLNANVSGFCVEEVIFSILVNGVWMNFTGVENNPTNYTAIINANLLNNSKNVDWTVYTKNCLNITVQDGLDNFYVNNKTVVSVNPAVSDGLAGWYISHPAITLINPDAANIIYRWDGLAYSVFSGTPFGLENTPNNGNTTGGTMTLTYRSNLSCGRIENDQSRTFKFDFTDPLINDLHPAHNSDIQNDLTPQIQALIDEVYQSNSGINKLKVFMFLDGQLVIPTVLNSGSLDVIARYNVPSPLAMGWHNATINATDKSGRNSELTWYFIVNISDGFNLTVNSPENKMYNTKREAFNISMDGVAAILEYMNHDDERPRWITLCRDCSEYGESRIKTQSLNNGWNNITIKGTTEFGIIRERNLSIFIDSKAPQIKQVMPRKNQGINGSEFFVKYTEGDLQNISLIFNPTIPFNSCLSGTNVICSQNVDLTAFNGEFIEFYFELRDKVNSVNSSVTRVLVDTQAPVLNVTKPEQEVYSKKVPFKIDISEQSLLDYYDSLDSNPRWKRLCSNCNSLGIEKNITKTFKTGSHQVRIRATDKAGNSDTEDVEFSVI